MEVLIVGYATAQLRAQETFFFAASKEQAPPEHPLPEQPLSESLWRKQHPLRPSEVRATVRAIHRLISVGLSTALKGVFGGPWPILLAPPGKLSQHSQAVHLES